MGFLTVTTATLTGITVTPVNPTLPSGVRVRFVATGTLSDGTTSDVSASVTWASTNPTVASVDPTGAGVTVGPGRATVSARLGMLMGSTDVTVTSATLVSIAVNGLISTLPVGGTVGLRATGTFSDGSTADVTTAVTWATSAPTVAGVSNAPGSQGTVTGLASGTATVTATLAGITGSATVTVTATTLTSIRVTPANPTLPARIRVRFTATATYSDGTSADVTARVAWASTDPTVVPIARTGDAITFGPGTATITATLGGVTGSSTVTVSSARLTGIALAPTSLPLPLRGTGTFTVTGTFDDGTTADLTATAFFFSTNRAVANVSNAPGSQGAVTGTAAGTAVVIARVGSFTAMGGVTVTAAALTAITVTPATVALSVGGTQSLRALGTFSDGSSADVTTLVTWTSSALGTASVSNAPGSQGTVTGNAAGAATVTATLGAVTGTSTVTVHGAVTLTAIAVTPPTATVAVGSTALFTATGTFSDGTTADVTATAAWTSSAPGTARVTAGRVTALAPGLATVTASVGTLSGTAAVTVPRAPITSVAVTPATASTGVGGTVAFHALATLADGTTQDVTATAAWSVGIPGVAMVSPAGVATGAAPGTTAVTASVAGVTGTASLTVTMATVQSIQVTPMDPTVGTGVAIRFTATGIFSDGTSSNVTTSVAWSSSSPAAVLVDTAGNGRSGSAGTSVVSATLGTVTGTTTVTVTPASLTALAVTPLTSTVSVGGTVALRATGRYSDGSTADLTATVTWTSSAAGTVAVSNAAGSHGTATGIAAGTATVTATLGTVTSAATVMVSTATVTSIAVTPPMSALGPGGVVALRATGTFSDGSSRDVTTAVTWTTGAPGVASVSNVPGTQGQVTAVSAGTATVTASLAGVSATATVTVTAATLAAITVTPARATTTAGLRSSYTATGTYSDGTLSDLTTRVTWTTGDATVATIANAAGIQGQLLARAPGTTTVSAAFLSVTGSTSVTVTGATLRGLTVTPIAPSTTLGFRVQFTVEAIFSDGTSRNVTGAAVWSSSLPAVATIDSRGSATPVAAGSTVVTATYMALTGTSTLTVTPGVITSIQVTPIAPRLAPGTVQFFTAEAIFSDGSSRNVTGLATWVSSDPTVLGVSTTPGSRGRGTGLSAGAATVTATYMGITGSTHVTVTSAVITSLSVNPASVTVPNGTRRQFTVQAIYSDGSSRDVTGLATWTSSAPTVAQVSDTPGSRGFTSALSAGAATITAQYMGVAGTGVIRVTPATLTSVQVTPFLPTVAVGNAIQLQATGIYSDGTSITLTGTCTWTSASAMVAAVSTAPLTHGRVTGLSAGSAVIHANCTGVTGMVTVTVTSAAIVRLQVTPFISALPVGYVEQLTATAVYSDGSTRNITGLATWTSSLPASASVSDAAGSKGVVTAAAPGPVTVTAQYMGAAGTATVNVSSATLTAIVITPAMPTVAVRANTPLTATGTFSDGTMVNLTGAVTWLSSDPMTADVSNAAGSRGLATGFRPGTVTVTAQRSGVTGTSTLTVR